MSLWQTFNKDPAIGLIYLKRAIRLTIAMIIVIVLAHFFHWFSMPWAGLGALLVMQMTIGATLRKGFQRIIGFILGLVIGWLIAHGFSVAVSAVMLLAAIAITFYLKALSLRRIGMIALPMSILSGLVLAMLIPGSWSAMMLALKSLVLGGLIAVLLSFIILPVKLGEYVHDETQVVLKSMVFYSGAIIALLLNEEKKMFGADQYKRQFICAVKEYRRIFTDWRFEVWWLPRLYGPQVKLMWTMDLISQLLFSMHQLARESWSAATREMITVPLKSLDNKLQSVGAILCLRNEDSPVMKVMPNLAEDIDLIEEVYQAALAEDRPDTNQLASLLCDLNDLHNHLMSLLVGK